MSQSVFDLEFADNGILPVWKLNDVFLTEHIQQMDQHQDQTYIGDGFDEDTGECFKYGMVTDGHGKGDCIAAIRSIPTEILSQILGKSRPVEELWNMMSGYSGGATMCLTKIYEDRIECINCGDSQVAVFKDYELLYFSKEHNWENQADRKRLIAMNPQIKFTPSTNIKVISDTKMVGSYMEYASWEDGSKLACTQALGDSGKTGCYGDHYVIPIIQGSIYKILIGSDGFWDVINKDDPLDMGRFAKMSGQEAIDFVRSRWLQVWEMAPLGKTEFTKGQYIPSECDDISVVVADIIPV